MTSQQKVIGSAVALALGISLLGATPAFAAEPTVDEVVSEAVAIADSRFPKPNVDTDVEVTVDDQRATADVQAPGGATVSIKAVDADDSVVIPKNDGVQVVSVLNEGEKTAAFDVDLPENTTLLPASGGYEIVVDGGIVVGKIYAPWAIDANGKALITTYALSGSKLTQSVNTAGAAYPIAVDPRVSVGFGIYVRYSRAEVNSIAPQSQGAFVGTLVAATCAKTKLWYAIAVCSAMLASYGVALKDGFEKAKAENKCMEIVFNHPVPTIKSWRRYNTDPACHNS